MLPAPSLLTTIFAFLLVLGPLVLVHELGHYLVGRLFGVGADAFSIGFGKELVGWTDRRGTRWKLSALPLGGYVQFAGDMNPASQPDRAVLEQTDPAQRSRLFHFKPLWQRALIVLAGPLTNLLVAVAIFAAFNVIYGRVVASPVVAGFAVQSSARDAGVKLGDRIVSLDGSSIAGFEQIRDDVLPYPGRTVTLGIERQGHRLALAVPIASRTLVDQFGNRSRVGQLGIAGAGFAIVRVSVAQAVPLAFSQCADIVHMMVTGIGQIVSGERSADELGGPIKIARYSGEQLTLGWTAFVYFVALISINLAFINLLPIPALDGGHLAFYAAEAVRRKPIGAKGQEWALRTGLAFVLALTVFVTVNDLASLRIFGG